MKFLRNLLATIVGLIIFTFMAIIVFGIFISAASSAEKIQVKDNSLLYIKLNRPIGERAYEDPFSELFTETSSNIGLIELIASIEEAKDDDKIKGIYLEGGIPMAGFASLEAIRNALIDFKTSGKFITSYSEIYTEGGFYLASVADNIYLNPRGDLEFNGVVANVSFLKGTLEKLEIEPEVFKVGDYKSAMETFTRKDLSEENEEQLSEILNSIYGHYLEKVSEARSISLDELTNISDSMLVRNPEDAEELGLVTGLKYLDEVLDHFREQLEIPEDDDKINFITFDDYFKSTSPLVKNSRSSNKIAVIVGSGDIHGGKSDNQTIGSTSFAKEIRKAREDDDVKAVVLRINSPGGSALASDVMWREVVLTSQVKPIIASMSDYAASGGYYMAMACDTIVAEPTTITGSIGIFMALFNMEGFLENKIGITNDVVKTGEYSDLITVTRPLTEGERRIFQNMVEEGYDDFTTKAAEGRDMPIEDLMKVAGGRIWSGSQALEIDLVDVLGNLDDAIDIAASSAGVEDDYKVRYYPEKKGILEQIRDEFSTEISTRILKHQVGEFYPTIKKVKELERLQGLQSRMLFDVEIR